MTTILSTREDQYLFTNFQSNYWYIRRVITNKQWTFRIGYENLRLPKWSPYCDVTWLSNLTLSRTDDYAPKKRTSEFFWCNATREWKSFTHFPRYDIFILYILRFTLWITKRTIVLHSVNIQYVWNKLRFSEAKKSLIYLGPLLWRYLYNLIRDWCSLLCCIVSMF